MGRESIYEIIVGRTLGGHRDRWDKLVEMADPPSPEFRSWWVEAVADERAQIVLVLDGDRLVGGLPLEVERRFGVDRIRLLGHDLLPTSVDVVAEPDERAAVARQVVRWMQRVPDALVELDGLVTGSTLQAALQASDVGVEVRELPGAPFVDLTTDHEAWVASRSRNYRKGTRRMRRRLAERGYTHRVLGDREVEFGLAALRRLHAQRFGGRSGFLPYFERFADVLRAGVAAGGVHVHVLQGEAEDVAAIDVVFDVDGRLLDYQSGRIVDDPELDGAGTVLTDDVIAYARRTSAYELDLGRHPDDYKMRIADGVRPTLILTASWGPRTSMLLRAHDLRSRTRRVARRLVGRGGGRRASEGDG
jgi:CelD/BcsL family acetyltransferase involved in cellulose biosynthesis